MNETVDDFLSEIVVKLPGSDIAFSRKILAQFDRVGLNANRRMRIKSSNDDFYPKISIEASPENRKALVEFATSKGCKHEVLIENTTGVEKKNPLEYSHLSIDTIIERFSKNGIIVTGLDHVGFNLPWFSSNIHPLVKSLRRDFSSRCLYHKYPTGEPWDFIIPGFIDEILMLNEVDYSKTRTPKFEIVSFDASSTPLIQFDIQCNKKHELISMIFPESLHDDQLTKTWIYIENSYNVDICFVLSKASNKDWSSCLKGNRIFAVEEQD